MFQKYTVGLSLLLSVISVSGCANQPTISGAAAGGASSDANPALARCDLPLGTLAVNDGRFSGSGFSSQGTITTIDPLIRLAVQQSNCFVITAIGNAQTTANLDRLKDKMRNSGEYRLDSKQEKGQAVAADYLLEPQVVINNESTGGMKLGASMFTGLVGKALTTVTGGIEAKTTQVALTLTDIRSTVQIGISEGSSSTNNLSAGLGGLFFGGGGIGGGNASAFTKTPEGKATAAAFVVAYNNMVNSLKNYKAQDVQGGLGRGGALKVN